MGDKVEENLSSHAAEGAKWGTAAAIVGALTQFAQLILLSRFLDPADFGAFAILSVIVGVIAIFPDWGVSSWLARDAVSESRLRKIYLVTIGTAVILSLSLVALAHPLLKALELPGYHRQFLLLSLAAVPCISLSQISIAKLQFHLNFDSIGKAEIIASLALLATSLCCLYFEYFEWALVGALVVASAVRLALTTYWASKHRVSPHYEEKTELKGIYKFGRFVMGNNILTFASQNGDKLLIGVFLGDSAAGLYTIAREFIMRPFLVLMPIIGRVALPLMAKLEGDAGKLSLAHITTVSISVLLFSPIYLTLIAGNEVIVNLILGDAWKEVSAILVPLSALGFFYALGCALGSVLIAKGRSDIALYWNLFVFISTMLAITLGAKISLVLVSYFLLLNSATVLYLSEFF